MKLISSTHIYFSAHFKNTNTWAATDFKHLLWGKYPSFLLSSPFQFRNYFKRIDFFLVMFIVFLAQVFYNLIEKWTSRLADSCLKCDTTFTRRKYFIHIKEGKEVTQSSVFFKERRKWFNLDRNEVHRNSDGKTFISGQRREQTF